MKYQNLTAFLFTFLFSISSLGSQSQAALKLQEGPSATIVEFGIYEVVKRGTEYEHKESTAGYAEEGVEVALVKSASDIPLQKGIIFGIEWEAQGLPDIPIKITFRVKHPTRWHRIDRL